MAPALNNVDGDFVPENAGVFLREVFVEHVEELGGELGGVRNCGNAHLRERGLQDVADSFRPREGYYAGIEGR